MKVLCIGNNTVDTDNRTTQLAQQNNSTSYGLLSELDGEIIAIDLLPGYYHSSVYDIEYNHLLDLAKRFDQVIILDQPKDEYSHPDAFYRTIRLANELSTTMQVTFLDPTHGHAINLFEDLVKTNKSFCIFPFIELMATNGSTNVCCRSDTEVTRLTELKNYQSDPNYTAIRNKMLAGELIPEHCSSCYRLEDQGIVSARIQETVEWANRLGFTSVDELKDIKSPVYYEVRPSNVCNLQCRTCYPGSSHLIAKEYQKLGFTYKKYFDLEYTNFDFIDFANIKKLYVGGGEPTAMVEFYEFLDKCIANNKTDFEMLINTNGTKLSNRFKTQLKHFRSVSFVVSMDGYKQLNHYIRWPSDWDQIISNVDYLYNNYSISINITVSIYNILTLADLINFLDTNYPRAIVHCQFASTPGDRLSGLIFPYPEMIVNRLLSIKNLNCYKNDRLLSSFVDGVIEHYANHPTLQLDKLRTFFKFNDKLDESRNIALVDYVPELEQARSLVQSTD